MQQRTIATPILLKKFNCLIFSNYYSDWNKNKCDAFYLFSYSAIEKKGYESDSFPIGEILFFVFFFFMSLAFDSSLRNKRSIFF